MPPRIPNDPIALALAALAATLGSERRAQRFVEMTGIGTSSLGVRAAEPAFLAALLRFLEGHEPDLVDVAEELGVPPGDLVWARHEIEQGAR